MGIRFLLGVVEGSMEESTMKGKGVPLALGVHTVGTEGVEVSAMALARRFAGKESWCWTTGGEYSGEQRQGRR